MYANPPIQLSSTASSTFHAAARRAVVALEPIDLDPHREPPRAVQRHQRRRIPRRLEPLDLIDEPDLHLHPALRALHPRPDKSPHSAPSGQVRSVLDKRVGDAVTVAA